MSPTTVQLLQMAGPLKSGHNQTSDLVELDTALTQNIETYRSEAEWKEVRWKARKREGTGEHMHRTRCLTEVRKSED